MSSISYFILETIIIKLHNDDCIKKVVKNTKKRNITLLFYISGIMVSFIYPLVAMILYTANLFIWIVPNKKWKTL